MWCGVSDCIFRHSYIIVAQYGYQMTSLFGAFIVCHLDRPQQLQQIDELNYNLVFVKFELRTEK